jgi:transglutaminase-like putative cysteine protease
MSSISYRVVHNTKYVYSTPVATSQHVAYLQPRELPRQHVRSHDVHVEPEPAMSTTRVDYFGNVVRQFQILKPHSTLIVSAESIVDVHAMEESLGPLASPPWEDVRRSLTRRAGVTPDVSQFISASPYVPVSTDIERFARESFTDGRPIVDAGFDLMHRIHERFAFDSAATTVTTPLTRVFEEERGVCQDFAHVGIACVRSLGLAARYVSGYLLTDPPPGQPRLIGADASHAWLSFYCPQTGWVDIDPTNDLVAGERHITAAWGRDYGDVCPLRGVILGGAEHQLFVGVSVMPIDEVVVDSRPSPVVSR